MDDGAGVRGHLRGLVARQRVHHHQLVDERRVVDQVASDLGDHIGDRLLFVPRRDDDRDAVLALGGHDVGHRPVLPRGRAPVEPRPGPRVEIATAGAHGGWRRGGGSRAGCRAARREPRRWRRRRALQRRRGRGRCCRECSAKNAIAAAVAASRPRGLRPVMAPRKSLRDSASSTGRPRSRTSSMARSTSTVWCGVLVKSGPGSRMTDSRGRPELDDLIEPLSEERADLAGHVGVELRILPAHLRLGRRVHDHQRRVMADDRRDDLGVQQAAHVVDDGGPGLEHRIDDQRLVRVDAHQDVRVLLGHPLHQRENHARLRRRPRPRAGW